MHRKRRIWPGPSWRGVSAFCLWALLAGLAGCSPTVDFAPLPIPRDQTVVVLNGENISLQEFDTEFRLMSIHYGAVGEIEMRTTKRRLFDQVVDRHLLVQQALRKGVSLKKRDLEKYLRDTLADAPPGFLSQLESQGVPNELWKRKMAQELLIEKWAEQEVYPGVKVGGGEVEEYYWNHLDEFYFPEAFRARHLVVRTQKELDRAQACLKSGVEFPQACATYSVGPQKEDGGDWGWMPTASLPGAYVRTLRALRPGEVSKALKDSFGYHLFQLMEYRPTRVRTLKEAEPLARQALLRRERDRQFVEWLTNLKKNAKVEINPDLSPVVGYVLEEPRADVHSPEKKKSRPHQGKPKKSTRARPVR